MLQLFYEYGNYEQYSIDVYMILKSYLIDLDWLAFCPFFIRQIKSISRTDVGASLWLQAGPPYPIMCRIFIVIMRHYRR